MNITFRITLTKSDWEENVSGWRCPALTIPGAAVAAVFAKGDEIDKNWYDPRPGIPALRWTHGDAPDQVVVSIALTQPLYTEDLTLPWKKLTVILPVIASIVVALITIFVPKLIAPKAPVSLPSQIVTDEKAEVIERFYDYLNSQKFDDAWALLHRVRKEQIKSIVKDANDFKKRYVSTAAHTHLKIARETSDDTEPTYMVAFDVQDDVLRSVLYQLKEQQVDEAIEKGIINRDKLVALVFTNLSEYFTLSDQEKERIPYVIGKRRLSSLFSPVFVEEFAEELGLDQKRRPTIPLKDSIWRHFILRLTLRKEDNDWKILRGLDKPIVAEYGPGAAILSK